MPRKTKDKTAKEKGEKQIALIASPEKRIPKYSTRVLFSLRTNGQIILTFIHQESPDDTEGTVIERLLVDSDHAKNIVQVLGDLLKRFNKE